jgi:hypothetical protein
VKRSTAINRLSDVADALDRAGQWPGPPVVAAYVFGAVLDPVSELEVVQLALVVDEPPEDVPWMSRPARLEALASLCRFDKLPMSWRWRPAEWPVWNHEISRAVRFWSSGEGRDEAVLRALADARVNGLRFEQPGGPEEMGRQLTIERDASRGHLAAVTAQFYDRDWRREHSGEGTHPEDHLWWATAGYLDLDDAIAALDA